MCPDNCLEPMILYGGDVIHPAERGSVWRRATVVTPRVYTRGSTKECTPQSGVPVKHYCVIDAVHCP